MHVRAEIGDDARAGGRDHLELVRTGVDAMRQRQPLREEADVAQPAHHVRKMLIGPGALIHGLQQMHVDAAAGSLRIFRHCLQQRLRAPLHAGGPELHIDHRASDRRGNGVGQFDIGLWRHRRADKEILDGLTVVAGKSGENRFGVAIDDRILVAHGQREGDADADVGCSPRDRLGFIEDGHRSARSCVVNHHRRAAGLRRPRQRGGRGQVGIDRRAQCGPQDPAFQGHTDRAEGRRGRAGMIMRVDEGGNDEGARADGPRSSGDVSDDAAVVAQRDVVADGAVRTTEQAGCRNLRGHDRRYSKSSWPYIPAPAPRAAAGTRGKTLPQAWGRGRAGNPRR